MEESRTHRVLVVDDDPAIRLVCATNLRLDGHEVIEASNGQDALQLALTASPDVLLLDLSIPVLDGFAVASALRTDERTRSLPIVVLSGESGPTIAQQVHEMGAAGFFSKPFEPGAVAAFVRGVLAEIHDGPDRAPGGHAV